MRKLPMLPPGEMTDAQLAQVQFLVCMTATEVLPSSEALVAPCAAGCDCHVVYSTGYPDALPKVCGDCAAWLMCCEVA